MAFSSLSEWSLLVRKIIWDHFQIPPKYTCPLNYRGLDNPAGTGWLLQLCGGRHCQPPYTGAPILHPIPSAAPVWFSCHSKQKPTKSRKFQLFFTFFSISQPFRPPPPLQMSLVHLPFDIQIHHSISLSQLSHLRMFESLIWPSLTGDKRDSKLWHSVRCCKIMVLTPVQMESQRHQNRDGERQKL